jgi:hypothetical protein
MKSIRTLVAGVVVVLSACATGPSIKDTGQALPSVDAGKARIFFYLFRDVPPGKYAVTTTMTSEVVNIDIRAGEKKYIKLNYGFGFRIYPELVDATTGEAEASDLSLVGQGKS